MSIEVIYFLLILSVILSAFFSGTEMAFVASNKFKIELDKNKKGLNARLLTIVTKSPSKFISTMLFGNSISLVVFGVMAALLLEPPIEKICWDWFGTAPKVMVIVIQTILSTLFILITAEFMPKVISSLNPNRFLNILVLPTSFFYFLFQIPVFAVVFIAKTILSIFRVKMKEEMVRFERTDLNYYLQQVTDASEDAKMEVENEVKILQNVLEFPSVRARDCMVPRTEIIAIEAESTMEVLKETMIHSGHSKVLIYRETMDDMIGFVDSHHMFRNPKELGTLIMPVLFVPETMFIKDILTQFSSQRRTMAVVVDEYGGTAGLITMEDIVEQIFGEIEDELDVEQEVEQRLDENEFLFSGRLEIDYLNDNYRFDLPESEEYTTIAGLILFHYPDLPDVDDEVIIKNFSFTITKMAETRIEQVKMKLLDD